MRCCALFLAVLGAWYIRCNGDINAETRCLISMIRQADPLTRRAFEAHYNVTSIVPTLSFFRQFAGRMEKLQRMGTRKGKWLVGEHQWSDVAVNDTDCLMHTPECSLYNLPHVRQQLDKLFRHCCQSHGELRAMLATLVKLTSSAAFHQIKDGGLLGIKRHHGTLTAWDEDIDVVLPWEDSINITGMLRTEFKQRDLAAHSKRWSNKNSDRVQIAARHTHVLLDVYFLNSTKWLERSGGGPLEDCWLWDVRVQCPSNWKAELEWKFQTGMSWLTSYLPIMHLPRAAAPAEIPSTWCELLRHT
eukprot:NODE_2781_length_993_cov_45.986143_g2761_i0.p1 GENE.NODE_2781_length_993_cov_45.986143_g2761_i0~~NODE_2781_length_993_cov_45.986143_g2761_i0.p1  ORF type:complete len:302 (-),score=13.03 NODE_2781_length_993_cov_45.986143_g2761_i0:36-941(-)